MPLDEKAPVWNYAGKIYKKQVPCTRFIDELEAVDVKLVSSPNKDELYKLMKNVAFVSFGKDWDEFSIAEAQSFIEETVVKDGMLPLANEMNNFTFLIRGVTRIMTHGLVRTRVGVTYAQQSTGNSDMRHCDILVPRVLAKPKYGRQLESYIKWCIDSKIRYSKFIDAGISPQDARMVLPSTNSNMIYVSFNLASLIGFYGKRSDTTEEYLQGNEICRQIKKIFDEKYPELSILLKSNCGRSCAHTKNSPLVNGVYYPSKEDDVFHWNSKSFLMQGTRDEMCWHLEPVKIRYFNAKKEVDVIMFK